MSDDKKQQISALGRLGWTTRRIERETGIRRGTISTYLMETEVELRLPRGRTLSKPASPRGEVTPTRKSLNRPPATQESTPSFQNWPA